MDSNVTLETVRLERKKLFTEFKELTIRIHELEAARESLKGALETKSQEFEDLVWEMYKDGTYYINLDEPTKTEEESEIFWALRVRAYKEYNKQFENLSLEEKEGKEEENGSG